MANTTNDDDDDDYDVALLDMPPDDQSPLSSNANTNVMQYCEDCGLLPLPCSKCQTEKLQLCGPSYCTRCSRSWRGIPCKCQTRRRATWDKGLANLWIWLRIIIGGITISAIAFFITLTIEVGAFVILHDPPLQPSDFEVDGIAYILPFILAIFAGCGFSSLLYIIFK